MEGSWLIFERKIDTGMIAYHQEARRDGTFAGLTSGLAGGKFDTHGHPCALSPLVSFAFYSIGGLKIHGLWPK